MTPVSTPASPLVWLATRARRVVSPVKLLEAKVNWSAVPPTPAPPPWTMNVEPSKAAEPAIVGEPMSASDQPVGRSVNTPALLLIIRSRQCRGIRAAGFLRDAGKAIDSVRLPSPTPS